MKKTIMIVDDEFEVAQAVEAILVDEGFEVLSCGDGMEAQQALKTRIPDLIISDIMMPHCNGYQLLGFVKNESSLKKVPFILMSAAAPKDVEYKADNFMRKPFTLEILLDVVDKYLGKSK